MLYPRDWSLLLVVLLCTLFIPRTAPQHYSLPLAGQQSFSRRQDSDITDFNRWQQSLQNRSDSKGAFLDPILSSDPGKTLKNDIARQLFNSQTRKAAFPQSRPSSHQQSSFTGFQQNPNLGYQQFPNQGFQQYPNLGFNQFPTSGFQQLPNPGFQQYQKSDFLENQNSEFQQFPDSGSQKPPSTTSPQIYKLDNVIIIANPQQSQQQPCVSDRIPPPKFPNPHKSSDSNDKKPGEDDHNCVWAIITCCSPKEPAERHNCFNLLGCSGSMFDGPPCDPDKILAATDTALQYYRNEFNRTSDTPTDNRV